MACGFFEAAGGGERDDDGADEVLWGFEEEEWVLVCELCAWHGAAVHVLASGEDGDGDV